MWKSLPPVKLILTPSGFDFLMETLEKNFINLENKEPESHAKKLMEKLMKYSRIITDEETKEQYIRILMYPDEASEMILQLISSLTATNTATLDIINTILDIINTVDAKWIDLIHNVPLDGEYGERYSKKLIDDMTTNELPFAQKDE